MNTQSHRLVFNPTRACLVAVAETARGCGKSTIGGTRTTRRNRASTRSCASNRPLALVERARAAINSVVISKLQNAPSGITISANKDALAGTAGSTVTAISDNLQLATTTSNDRLQGAAALKAGYDAYKFNTGGETKAIEGADKYRNGLLDSGAAQTAAQADKADPNAGAAVAISFSVGSNSSKQDSSSTSTTSRGTSIQAGTINITATEGNINATAAKLQAKDITLDAAKDINLSAAANTTTLKNSSESHSVGAGVTFGLGQQSGISFQLSAAQGNNNANGTETVHDNTLVTATNKLTIKSGNNTNLNGAQLAGNTVKMDVGGDLNIATQQDTSTFNSEQHSSGFNMSLCIPPLCYGTQVTATVTKSDATVDHNYQSATGQSGIAAGSGGYNITVKGNTDLKGAAITSTATADKNTLTTASLTSTDLQNQQTTNSQSSSSTVGNNVSAMVVGNVMGALNNGAGMPASGSQSSTTQSVITGTVKITGTGDAAKDATSATNVATLTTRDAATANGGLKNTLTLQQGAELEAKQKTNQENQQITQMVGSVTFNAVGDIAQSNGWADGSPQKIVLHTVAGYVTASAGGANGTTGAVAAATNEALSPHITALVEQAIPMPENATDAQKQQVYANRKTLQEAAVTLVGAGAVAATGGTKPQMATGGTVALLADQNNRQLHPDEKKILRERARAKANEIAKTTSGYTDEKSVQGLADRLYLVLADETTALIDAKEQNQNNTYRQQLADTKKPGLQGHFDADNQLALQDWAHNEALNVQKDYAGQTIKLNGKDLIADGDKVTMFGATTRQYNDSRLFNTGSREVLLKQFAGNTNTDGKQDVEPAVRVGLGAYREGTADKIDSTQKKTLEGLRATNGAAAFDSPDIDFLTMGGASLVKAGGKKVVETVATAIERRTAQAESRAAAETAIARTKIENNAGRDDDALSTNLLRGTFRNETHVIANPDVLAGLFKQGGVELRPGVTTQDVFQKVIQQPIGSRLSPEEYLNPTFVSQELARYDNGATKIVLKSNFDKWGLGQTDGTAFVIPKAEADQLIKSVGSDPVKLADALGLPRSALDGNSLIRIDIPNPRTAGLRLPSGNEAGANSNWIPGGKLPGGASEAVIDANKIVKFIETPIQPVK